MKNHKLRFLMPFLLISLLFWSCTNLEENPVGVLTPDDFLKTEAELLAAVIPVYASLRDNSNTASYPNLQELTSDEMAFPQRGGVLFGRLQAHTWTPYNGTVDRAWTDAYRGIARANATLDLLAQSTSESALIPIFMAEVRFLRAFYYWWLVDLFGGVPIVTAATADSDNPPQQNTRQEVFDFSVAEITAALPDLEESFGADNYGRVTKGAAHALLATLYLNAEVYTGTPMWNECVQACDAVINSGRYDLLPNYPDVFALDNEGPGNMENIFVVGHLPEGVVGFTRQMATLHYNQLPQTPWNGFAVLADFYNKFDTTDVRFNQLLVGPQLVLAGPNAGQQAFERQGDSLIFTVEFPLSGAAEGSGVRILKWPVDPNQSGGNSGNDLAIFRYAHILLTKAEALNEMMGPNQESIDLINQVRERAFEPDKPIALADFGSTQALRDRILDERGFELLWESFRRQDLIRTGHFLEAWTLKEASDGPHRKLFPIPRRQLDANPNLVQNPGYW